MSKQCPCTGFEIGQSHTKLPSFLSQVLLSIQMMQVNPIFKRGVGLKDVARFMKSYFKLNGDVVSQVETSLLQGVEQGILYKTNNNKYLIVGALARVQLARGKSRKNLALESLEVFLHHSNAPRAASRKESRSRSRSRATSNASSCGSVMNLLGQLERFLGNETPGCDCTTRSKSGSRKRRRKHTKSRSKSRSRSKCTPKRKGTRSKSRSKGRTKEDEETELKQTQYTVNNAALLKGTSSATKVGACSGQTSNVNEVVGKVVDKVAKRSASRGNQRKESRCKCRRSKSRRSAKKRPVRSCRLKKR